MKSYLRPLIELVCRFPVFAGLIILLILTSWGTMLSEYGASNLIWGEGPTSGWGVASAGFSFALIFGVIFYVIRLTEAGRLKDSTKLTPPISYLVTWSVLMLVSAGPAFIPQTQIMPILTAEKSRLPDKSKGAEREIEDRYWRGDATAPAPETTTWAWRRFLFLAGLVVAAPLWWLIFVRVPVFAKPANPAGGVDATPTVDLRVPLILFLLISGGYLLVTICHLTGGNTRVPPVFAIAAILNLAIALFGYLQKTFADKNFADGQLFFIVTMWVPVGIVLMKYFEWDWLAMIIGVVLAILFVADCFRSHPGWQRRLAIVARLTVAVPFVIYLIPRSESRFEYHLTELSPYYAQPSPEVALQPLNASYRPDLRTYDELVKSQGDLQLLNDNAVLDAWLAQPELAATGGDAPELIVVSVSGGASSSAYFVANFLLDREMDEPNFLHRVRVIAGASGGMLGAAYTVARANNPDSAWTAAIANVRRERAELEKHRTRLLKALIARHASAQEMANPDTKEVDEFEQHKRHYIVAKRKQRQDLLADLREDCLSSVLRQWAFHDVSCQVLRGSTAIDRGWSLEQEWKSLMKNGSAGSALLDQPFKRDGTGGVPDLYSGEKAGKIPSLIFSPALVEDGRRLLISNLNLDYMTPAKAQVVDKDLLSEHEKELSVNGVEFFRLFPQARTTFRLSTAVRLNASFPFVSPAATVPTYPTRRVVDAGYYDNYGISVAANWIHHNRKWLINKSMGQSPAKPRLSRVRLIQLRAYASEEDRKHWVTTSERFDDQGKDIDPRHAPRTISLSAEIDALFATRQSTMSFRNDERIELLSSLLEQEAHRKYFATEIAECNPNTSLTWHLSNNDVATIQNSMDLNSQAHLRYADIQVDAKGNPKSPSYWLTLARMPKSLKESIVQSDDSQQYAVLTQDQFQTAPKKLSQKNIPKDGPPNVAAGNNAPPISQLKRDLNQLR